MSSFFSMSERTSSVSALKMALSRDGCKDRRGFTYVALRAAILCADNGGVQGEANDTGVINASVGVTPLFITSL